MLKIKNYVKAESLAQAYELNQKKNAIVLGGMVWLKMGNRNIVTAIDLSGLGLDSITETDEEFVIGCMTPLHAIETHKALNEYTGGAVRESVRHIVGVQFRNCATVGGSIFGRFGFSDVLTMFLAMDTWVELYDRGRIPLTEFVLTEKDNDILVNVIVKKIIFLYYFNDMKGCVLTGLAFCLITMAGSMVSTHFTEIWYGAGLVAGSFAGWTTAYMRLQWMEKHLDIHIFCNGHLLKKKKGDCPSPKVFDRYEQ